MGAMLFAACSKEPAWDGSLETLLAAQPERFATVLDNADEHRVQIIYTQIDRDASNRPSFRSFTYRLDEDEYFYPASTVKLPTAALALEKINDLDVAGLTRDTAMLTGIGFEGQTPALEDPTSPTGLPSVANYVRKVLLVSDNDAFNRLYEFLGQAPLNDSLRAKGFSGARIIHRLEIALSVEANRHTNPVTFVAGDRVIYSQGPVYSDRLMTAPEPISLGKAEMVGGERLERPKDFADKNAYPLQAQHDVIRALMFPESVPAGQRFRLTADDYSFLRRHMSMYPGESGIAEYADEERYPEGYVKFLMFGGDAAEIPDNIRVFNKVGDAYGFLTDAAYIVDFENEIEFLLAATVYTNANQTFNDDDYEYDETGLPFLRDLGQAIYELELARDRPQPPNLEAFRLHAD